MILTVLYDLESKLKPAWRKYAKETNIYLMVSMEEICKGNDLNVWIEPLTGQRIFKCEGL